MLKHTQSQKLFQKLSPQQIQLMKLLQLPSINLEERIKEEIEDNPALEYEMDSTDDPKDEYSDLNENETAEDSSDFQEGEDMDINLDDYINQEDDTINDYNYGDDNYGDSDADKKTIPLGAEPSFYDFLEEQTRMLELNEHDEKIALQIIGSIDEDGYLRRELSAMVDDLAFSQGIDTSEEEVRRILELIQQFDPPGIGVWTLQESLVLQLKHIRPQTLVIQNAIIILENHFTEFTRKNYTKIQKSLGINDEELKEAITTIIKLNPKPGASFGSVSKAETYIIPDFYITNNNGKLQLSLNAANAPELRISNGYKEMLSAYKSNTKKNKRDKETISFIKQKIDSAKWFIDAIKQRQLTLIQTMSAIMKIQEEFFLTGDEMRLKPMILKDVADITGMDVSTVSRVANSKYVQTEYGTLKLKYFFSEALQTDTGESVSTREVKSMLYNFIANEEKTKPLSDEALAEMLLENGYNVARRTVTKYREVLNIPVARLRKEL